MTFGFALLEAPRADQSILQLVPVSQDRKFWTYTKTFLFCFGPRVCFFFFFFFKAPVDSQGFPGSSDDKQYACNAADLGSMPGLT